MSLISIHRYSCKICKIPSFSQDFHFGSLLCTVQGNYTAKCFNIGFEFFPMCYLIVEARIGVDKGVHVFTALVVSL